jgi:hypothetical protein
MPASRESKRILAMTRDLMYSPREVFLADVRDSLPRDSFDGETLWDAGRRNIEASIDADRVLEEHGFDRWGSPRETELG